MTADNRAARRLKMAALVVAALVVVVLYRHFTRPEGPYDGGRCACYQTGGGTLVGHYQPDPYEPYFGGLACLPG